MLNSLNEIGNSFSGKANSAVLKMVEHDRMAGSVPVWGKANTAKEETALKFAEVLNNRPSEDSSAFRLALAPEASSVSEKQDNNDSNATPFGFGDLFDMINPLHHIPLLGTLYRELTGDTIRSSGRVIGGAIFGGPLGAASSMVNMVVEHDTGRDLTGHAIDIARGRNTPDKGKTNTQSQHPNLNTRSNTTQNSFLTEALLAYERSSTTAASNITSSPYIRTSRL